MFRPQRKQSHSVVCSQATTALLTRWLCVCTDVFEFVSAWLLSSEVWEQTKVFFFFIQFLYEQDRAWLQLLNTANTLKTAVIKGVFLLPPILCTEQRFLIDMLFSIIISLWEMITCWWDWFSVFLFLCRSTETERRRSMSPATLNTRVRVTGSWYWSHSFHQDLILFFLPRIYFLLNVSCGLFLNSRYLR